jgi:hypothetical protein
MNRSGRGAAWLARLLGVQEVPGSNPGGPTKRTTPNVLPIPRLGYLPEHRNRRVVASKLTPFGHIDCRPKDRVSPPTALLPPLVVLVDSDEA